VRIHLLDNASPGDDAALFAQAHLEGGWQERVTLFPQLQNHGFGRGNNVVLEANPAAGAVRVCVYAPEGEPVTAAFRFPSPLVEFVSAASLGPLTRLMPERTLWHRPDITTQKVDWVAGAAVMLRMEVLLQTGFFDPDFFLYFEEVELMHRLARGGWECCYLREACVSHIEGAATDVRSGVPERKQKPAYWYRSQMLYDAKTRSKAGALWQATARLAGGTVHSVTRALRGRPPLHCPRTTSNPSLARCYVPVLSLTRVEPTCPTPSGPAAPSATSTAGRRCAMM